MPIFEYECAKCKNTFELLVSGGMPEAAKCPKCSSEEVVRLFSCFRLGGGASAQKGAGPGACSTCTSRNCSSCG